jgi:S-adenosylmethionine-diacylgycerolhomoserine-N-methlytransferase
VTHAAELMNRTYRRQRHVYDLTRKYYLLGRDRLVADLKPGAGDRVLEIGCGTGRNLIAAAHRYREARFFGVDVSTEMLASASLAVARAGLAGRIRLADGDATQPGLGALFGTAHFERVFFSYSLSMIPDWHGALDVALALTTPGGELRIVDFGGQEGLPMAFRNLLRAWLARFHVTPRDDLEAILRARGASLVAAVTVERPYRGYAQYALVRR